MSGRNDLLHTKNRERAIVEQLKGQETTTQLQDLLRKRVEHRGFAFIDDLGVKMWSSFADTLSQLSSCTELLAESAQITHVSGRDGGASVCSLRVQEKEAKSTRRGCYKRRISSEPWITVSPIMEDGYAWRKYGQKTVLHFQHPRCYFRCSNENQGCKATKQVQLIQENPIQFQTTYFNPHTCENESIVFVPHELLLAQEPIDSNIISFQPNINIEPKPHHLHDSQHSVIASSAKEEEDACQAKLLSLDFEDIFGFKPLFAPLLCSYQEEFISGPSSSCASDDNLQWFEFDQDIFNYFKDLD